MELSVPCFKMKHYSYLWFPVQVLPPYHIIISSFNKLLTFYFFLLQCVAFLKWSLTFCSVVYSMWRGQIYLYYMFLYGQRHTAWSAIWGLSRHIFNWIVKNMTWPISSLELFSSSEPVLTLEIESGEYSDRRNDVAWR